jgi:uncharacterized RDD family membrane protein YckC
MYCPYCGAPCEENATVCTMCKKALVPFSSYKEIVKADTFIAGSRAAHIGDRLLAQFLDGLLLLVVFIILGLWTAKLVGARVEGGFSLSGTPALLVIGAVIIIAFLYFSLMEAWHGLTLGKALIGIQVRGLDGNSLSLKSSLIRNVCRIVDGIGVYLVGFLIALLNRRRQRLGDHFAKCVVVDYHLSKLWYSVVCMIWIACLAGGLWLAWLIAPRVPQQAPTPAPAAATIGKEMPSVAPSPATAEPAALENETKVEQPAFGPSPTTAAQAESTQDTKSRFEEEEEEESTDE